MLHIVKFLDNMGVRLVSNKESVDTHTPIGKLPLTMFDVICEFERTNMLERQAEGIAISKRKGVYKGRQPFDQRKKFSVEKFDKLYERYLNCVISKSGFARQIGASRLTLDKLLKKRSEIAENT